MSDLIKRSDAIKAIWGEDINPSEDGMVFEAQSHIDRDIRLIPSADRPQGEWMRDDDYHRCSNCHCVAPLDGEEYWMRDKIREDLTEICPNCGARMFAKDINVPNKKGADDEND